MTMTSSPSPLLLLRQLSNRYFQLEELEDADRHCTEVFLHEDSKVTMGVSDGPKTVDASATWAALQLFQQEDDDDDDDDAVTVELTIRRTYRAGHKKRKASDMGEFEFDTVRILTGKLCLVGAKLAIAGTIHLADDREASVVGYFNMIDTTDEPAKQQAAHILSAVA